MGSVATGDSTSSAVGPSKHNAGVSSINMRAARSPKLLFLSESQGRRFVHTVDSWFNDITIHKNPEALDQKREDLDICGSEVAPSEAGMRDHRGELGRLGEI